MTAHSSTPNSDRILKHIYQSYENHSILMKLYFDKARDRMTLHKSTVNHAGLKLVRICATEMLFRRWKHHCDVIIVNVINLTITFKVLFVKCHSPMVESEAWSPVWCSEESLYSTSQINKTVTHQEEPATSLWIYFEAWFLFFM